MSNIKSNILVSICCITYNHAPFIRQALDGFLMQQAPSCVPQGAKMSDWCEILIHDDCSTDGTTEIVKEYAAKYPDLIFPLYEEENQYSKGVKVDFFNYNRAKGTYIAYCEGDDYWINPNKLQKQVDFMDAHPDYSICMHGCSVYDSRSKKKYVSHDFSRYAQTSNKREGGLDFTVKDYFDGYFGQPLTMLFRLSMFNFDWHNQYKYYRDTHEIYHLLKAGKGYWMNFDGGIYNIHSGGVSGGLTKLRFCEVSLPIDREFYYKTHDLLAKKQYIDTLEECVQVYAHVRPVLAFRYAFRILFLTGHPRSIIRNLKFIFGKK